MINHLLYNEYKAKQLVCQAVKAVVTSPTDAQKPLLDVGNISFGNILGKQANLSNDDFTKSPKLTESQLAAINKSLGKISGFKNGVCYYIGYIKHFGDEETPWEIGQDRYGTGDEANKKYLGRYGVVRNNWYDLSVKSISFPGSPDIPTPNPEDPDDDKTQITLTVKVNPWVKEETKIVPLE